MTTAPVRKNNVYDWTFVDVPLSLQRPDRRWSIVCRHVQEWTVSGSQPSIRDPFVKQAFEVERGRQSHSASRTQTNRNNPNLLAAIQLGQSASNVTDLVRAYLLARQSPTEVAEILGLRTEVVQWYARLYFDVCDRLNACDWVSTHVLVAAERTIGETELGTPEFVAARDRFVLFHAAYSGGIGLLRRIARPVAELNSGLELSPLNESPLARILALLWTVEASFPVCIQIHERVHQLLGNADLNDDELNRRLEILADYVEHCGQKQSNKKKTAQAENSVPDKPNVSVTETTEQVPLDDSKPTDPDSPCSESTAA